MPRNSSGIYSLPPAYNPVIPFTTITTLWANGTLDDVAVALTASLASNGTTNPVADLPMNGFRHTGVAEALTLTQYAQAAQVQAGTFSTVGAVSGSANSYAGTLSFGSGNTQPLIYGQAVVFIPNVSNTGGATLTLNGGSPVAILEGDGTPTDAGDLLDGIPYYLVYNGTSWYIIGGGVGSGGGGGSLDSVTSGDTNMITITTPVAGVAQVNPIANVANALVQLDNGGLIPANLLPPGQDVLLGAWDAGPGILPPNGTVSGQYYVVTDPGNLLLYVTDGVGGWIQVNTACVASDRLLWVNAPPEPVGWYFQAGPGGGGFQTATETPSSNTSTIIAANVQAWMNLADSTNTAGWLPVGGSRPMSGNLTGLNYQAKNGSFISNNITFSGGYKFVDAAGTGWARISNASGGGYSDLVSTTASGGVNSVATMVSTLNTNSLGEAWSVGRFGVGAAPRQTYRMDVYTAGTAILNVQDVTNTTALKIIAQAGGVQISAQRQLASGATSAVAGVPFALQNYSAAGALFNGITINNTRQVVIGDPVASPTAPGSISSTAVAAVLSGTLDFTGYQAVYGVGGGVISGITMTAGQVGRIIVTDGVAITLPVAVKLPRGGAVFGAVATIIGLTSVGSVIYSTFTPYD